MYGAMDIEILRDIDEERMFIKRFRALGFKAWNYNDAWVDRENNTIILDFANFKDNIKIGDKIAIGKGDKYKIAIITYLKEECISQYGFDYFVFQKKKRCYSRKFSIKSRCIIHNIIHGNIPEDIKIIISLIFYVIASLMFLNFCGWLKDYLNH